MTRKEFTRLVSEVLEDLPAEFASRLDNVEVVVEAEPSSQQLRGAGLDPKTDTMFGLYEGTPLEDRQQDPPLLPDKISIFYGPIVDVCASPDEIRHEVRLTVLHEIAHFFGIDDADLESRGY